MGLVELADRLGRGPQALDRAEKPAIGVALPPDVARTAPSRLPKTVQPAVIRDTEVRVRLDVVTREVSELCPCVEELRPARAYVGYRVPTTFDRLRKRGAQRFQGAVGFGCEDRFRRPGRRKIDVRHRTIVRGAERSRRTGRRPVSCFVMADADAERQQDTEAKAPTRLVLVRHAVTAHTGPLLSGRMPGVDLSDKGVGQADATAQRLAKLPIAAVYASPIERTTQTAQRIAAHHNLEVQALPGVIEAD